MSEIIRKIVIVICLIVFCASGAYLLNYALETTSASRQLKELKTSDAKNEGVDIKKLYQKNTDFRGWITVPGTRIDYPVMQSRGSDPEYYLHRNFDKEYSDSGTPFMDSSCERNSLNWLVYGHNMKIGSMFHDLLKYNDKEFWKDHKTFFLRDLDTDKMEVSNMEFEVIAACYTTVKPEKSHKFSYYEYTFIDSPNRFDEYIDGIKSESCYDTGIDADYGNQLVTLSTCAYHDKDGRFYIVGRYKFD